MVLPGRGISWKAFLRAVKDEWARDRVDDVAGSLTFFSVLALFPFLVFLIALASIIVNPQQTQALIEQLGKVAPPQVTDILGSRIRAILQQKSVGLLTFGAVAALWAASSGVVSLTNALNTAYEVTETRSFFRVRGIALVTVFLAAVFVIAASAAAVAAPAVARAVGGALGTAMLWLRIPVAGLLMIVLWALLYHFLPNVKQRFRVFSPGAVVGVALWLLASYLFSLYVTYFPRSAASYGALGGVFVLLMWIWISSMAVMLGAEIDGILRRKTQELEAARAAPEAPPPAAPPPAVPPPAPAPEGGGLPPLPPPCATA